jgi:hypothetical protein
MTYRCFWCDRTTKAEANVRIHRASGRLICLECLAYDGGGNR